MIKFDLKGHRLVALLELFIANNAELMNKVVKHVSFIVEEVVYIYV